MDWLVIILLQVLPETAGLDGGLNASFDEQLPFLQTRTFPAKKSPDLRQDMLFKAY